MNAQQHGVEVVGIEIAQDFFHLLGLVIDLDAQPDAQAVAERLAKLGDRLGYRTIVPSTHLPLTWMGVVMFGEREPAQAFRQGLPAVLGRIRLGIDGVSGVQVLVVELVSKHSWNIILSLKRPSG